MTIRFHCLALIFKLQTENLLCKVDPRPLRDTSCNITLKCFNKEAI